MNIGLYMRFSYRQTLSVKIDSFRVFGSSIIKNGNGKRSSNGTYSLMMCKNVKGMTYSIDLHIEKKVYA